MIGRPAGTTGEGTSPADADLTEDRNPTMDEEPAVQSEKLVATAAEPTLEVVRGLTSAHLGAQTPCAGYDVRKLINHLLFWGPSLEAAARKEPVTPPAEKEEDVDLVEGDGVERLLAQVERTAIAWSDPAAWEGVTRMGGPTQIPAGIVGGMVAVEVLVHGWDLARATGRRPHWPEDLLARTYELAAQTADQGRQMGVYGPEVPVPENASTLDRLLGLTGRDPAWTAPQR